MFNNSLLGLLTPNNSLLNNRCAIMVLSADKDCTVLCANPRLYDIIKTDKATFENTFDSRISRLVRQDKRDQFYEQWAKACGDDTIELSIDIVIDASEVSFTLSATKTSYANQTCFIAVLLDQNAVPSCVRRNAELEQMLEKILRHHSTYYWEYDIASSTIHVCDRCVEDFDLPRVITNYPYSFVNVGYVDKSGADEFINTCNKIKMGAEYAQTTIRATDKLDGKWYTVKYAAIFDEQGKPYKALVTAELNNVFDKANSGLIKALADEGVLLWQLDIGNRSMIQPSYMDEMFGGGTEVFNVPYSQVASGAIHPDDASAYLAFYDQVYAGKHVDGLRVRKYNKQKQAWDWYALHYTLAFSLNGTPIMAYGSASNVNLQVEYEKKLASFQSYQNYAKSSSVTSCSMNLTRNICDYTKGFDYENASGTLSVDDFFKWQANTIIDETQRTQFNSRFSRQTLLESYANGVHSFSMQCQAIVTNLPVWLEVHIEIIENPVTHNIEALLNAVNIDSVKRTQLIMDKLIESEYDAIASISLPSGKVINYGTKVSPYYEKTFNKQHSSDAMYDIKYDDILTDNEYGLHGINLADIIKELESNESYSVTVAYTLSDQVRYKRLKFFYINSSKDTILYTRTDVTDLQTAEMLHRQALQNALDDAQRANLEKSKFLSRMSHDMRTPMNGIIGLINLSYQEDDLSATLINNLDKMMTSSNYLLSLINDTLDMNKIESNRMKLNPEVVDSSALIEDILSSVIPTAREKSIELVITPINLQRVNIKVDKVRLQQIFNNIFSNAVKFTREGGRIDFIIECLSRDDHYAYDKIVVRDNGVGMSQDFLQKVFLPFEQENNEMTYKYAGSGLGLSIVKNLVDMMGGTIEIKSELNVGTEITIHLAFERVPDQPVTASVKRDTYDISGRRILLCEDQPLNAEIAKRLLVAKGCKVECAENGKQGLDLFVTSKEGHYDIILMDIRMPIMDGLTATRAIRASQHPDALSIPIVAMTANAFDEDIERSIAAGMNKHLAKPVIPTILYSIIYELTRKQT